MLRAMLRVRKYLAAWGAVFFCVLCFTLYLMLENMSGGSSRNTVLDENIVVNIENKIQHIEADMQRNRETILSIKKAVREMNKGDYKALDEIMWSAPTHDVKAISSVSRPTMPGRPVTVPKEMCPWADRPAAVSDVDTVRLYDELAFDDVDGGVWKQGWDITYSMDAWSKKKLRVFVVPHSHCDPGWIKTYEQYYRDQVQHILNNMVVKLSEDPRRKFIYAEMSFFSMWWATISEMVQESVRTLLRKGQLELVTGGWVMNDEASTHYSAIINQLTEGHLWLNNTIGYKPRSHWTIDPFGYSATNPYLIQQTGITAMLIQRVHYAVKKHLANTRQLEFIWRQNWDNSGAHDILTHAMPFYSYDVPHTCGPNPKICCQFDFARLSGSRYNCPWHVPPQRITDENVAERAATLLDQYRKHATLYRSNVLLVPLGDDFRYDKAEEWDDQTSNYQMLFDYMNSKPDMRVEAKFGTLSDYFDALHEELGVARGQNPSSMPSLTGDFFSYNDRVDNYWTGYFTSRPFYKHLDRELEHHLRAAEIAFSLVQPHLSSPSDRQLSAATGETLVSARRSLSLFQHHDGVTGTAKDFVVVDYGTKLLKALMDSKKIIAQSVFRLMVDPSEDPNKFNGALVFDIDETRESHDSLPRATVVELSNVPQPLLVYNSLGKERVNLVTVRVNKPLVQVLDAQNQRIAAQVHPVWVTSKRMSTTAYKVSFIATVPGFGVSRYSLSSGNQDAKSQMSSIAVITSKKPLTPESNDFDITQATASEFNITNGDLTVKFDASGLIQSVTRAGHTTNIHLSFVQYRTKDQREKSGAYLFLPDGPAHTIDPGQPVVRVIKGALMSEVHALLPNVDHVVRVVSSPGVDGSIVDIHNIVDIRQENNFEIAMKLETDINNNDLSFYTDQNGFQMQHRKTLSKLPLQGNFYPMTTNVVIQDTTTRLNVMSGQSLGVSSLEKGCLELMLDRRLNQDDNRGLGQPVLDNKRTPNVFRLLVEPRGSSQPKTTTTVYPTLSAHWSLLQLIHPMFVFPKHSSSTVPKLLPQFRPLSNDLPCDIHAVNLRTLQNSEVALLLHRFGFDCSSRSLNSKCAFTDGRVDMRNVFRELTVSDARRTSLTLLHNQEPTTVATIPTMAIHTYRLRLHK